jgi:signal transduction histidine kinase
MTGSDDSRTLGMMTLFGPAAESGQSNWDHKVLACLAYYAVLAVQNASHQEALKTAQEQRAVAETFAAVGDIAANLLHQLNNKIGAIPVRVQGIEDKCEAVVASDRYLASNLTEIERSANEAMEAVRVNLSQLRPIQFAEVSVVDCVREALSESRITDGVQIKLEELETLPAVLAGQRSLAWVFANLVQNAEEALGWQGTIVIAGRRVGSQQVEVTVSDNGPGIPLDLQERIFEWNYSGRKSNRSGGLGFGLWWVKTLMARLGGTVAVESDGQNGTTFRLRLPVVEKHD